MAISTRCPKPDCSSTSFEMGGTENVKGCRHNIRFIRCKLCGAAISALSERQDYVLEEIARKLNVR